MSHSEAREQLKQAQRHIDAAMKAVGVEKEPARIFPYRPNAGDVIRVDTSGEPYAAIVVDTTGPWIRAYLDLNLTKPIVFSDSSKVAGTVRFLRRATNDEMAKFGLPAFTFGASDLYYAPLRVGDLVEYDEVTGRKRRSVVKAVKNSYFMLGIIEGSHLGHEAVSIKNRDMLHLVRRATPAEMAMVGLVEKDMAYAYAPEIGHLVQYCEDGVHVRQGAVIALDSVRTTIRLVNSAEAGLLDSVPRSSDYCLAFIRYATGEEMGLKVGEPSPVWMPCNYESWMLAGTYPMVALDGETTYVVRLGVAGNPWTVEIDRGLGSTIRVSCEDKAQAMDVAQALAGKTLEWKRWF